MDFTAIPADINGDNSIFFNELEHKYTDKYNNVFNSVTTIIGNYHEEFDTIGMAKVCAKIGRNPKHPKYFKYRGKSEQQLIKQWSDTTVKACENGNRKHNYLEDTIKSVNNYKKISNKLAKEQLYTIPDIIKYSNIGIIDIDEFNEYDLKNRYPAIYNVLKKLIMDGWTLYAEIGVYNVELLVSGLIDLLAVKNNNFIIIDWKTNKAPIKFEAGYFNKDNDGLLTDEFIYKQDKLKYPLNHLADSVGNKYTLQISTYAFLTELFNMKFVGSLLFHIRTDEHTNEDIVKPVPLKYLKEDTRNMLQHYYSNLNLNNQQRLFI